MLVIADSGSLDTMAIVMGLLGGLGLFLYGMQKLSDGLKAVAGDGMKNLLAKLTANRFTAAMTGAAVTAVLQSSSITTVLVVGFVSAGLMSLAQTVGIIMGANVGTTITAQILAFNVTDYAWLMVAVGFAGWSFARRDYVKNVGAMLMGLGMLFIGMGQMGDATSPLREYQPFIDMMQQMDNRLLAILVGAAFTALVQSSSATIGIVIMLASQGYLSLEAGIALGIGSKVGTCVTAILSGLGQPAEARRVGVVHVLFNTLGAVLWLPFIDQLAVMAASVSPQHADLAGVERLAAETPRQVANAITIFASVNLGVMIWFVTPIARLAERLVPERPVVEPERIRPKYLDDVSLLTPALALDRINLELGRLGKYVVRMLDEAPAAVIEGTGKDLDRVVAMDEDVDDLHAAILEYMAQLAREEMKTTESRLLEDQLEIAHNLESIGDLIETNMVAQGRSRIEAGVKYSGEQRTAIQTLYAAVHQALDETLESLAAHDATRASGIVSLKPQIQSLVDAANDQVAEQIVAGDAVGIRRFRIESDIIDQIHRIYYLVRRIARKIADAE